MVSLTGAPPASAMVTTGNIALQPVKKMTIYILPHSHNDIGYTEIQTNVEKKQMNNLLTGIDYARRTKELPLKEPALSGTSRGCMPPICICTG